MSSSASSDNESTFSLEELEGRGESLKVVMQGLVEQMAGLVREADATQGQVRAVFKRAKFQATEWTQEPMKPRSAAVAAWCEAHALPLKPTLTEFFAAAIRAAKSVDLESRVLAFHRSDAKVLWSGETRLTVFDMIAQLPNLFL
jgi:delta 1-pyrroline-5-carboxylate dehydrogenase